MYNKSVRVWVYTLVYKLALKSLIYVQEINR